jgi:hypothetical protein
MRFHDMAHRLSPEITNPEAADLSNKSLEDGSVADSFKFVFKYNGSLEMTRAFTLQGNETFGTYLKDFTKSLVNDPNYNIVFKYGHFVLTESGKPNLINAVNSNTPQTIKELQYFIVDRKGDYLNVIDTFSIPKGKKLIKLKIGALESLLIVPPTLRIQELSLSFENLKRMTLMFQKAPHFFNERTSSGEFINANAVTTLSTLKVRNFELFEMFRLRENLWFHRASLRQQKTPGLHVNSNTEMGTIQSSSESSLQKPIVLAQEESKGGSLSNGASSSLSNAKLDPNHNNIGEPQLREPQRSIFGSQNVTRLPSDLPNRTDHTQLPKVEPKSLRDTVNDSQAGLKQVSPAPGSILFNQDPKLLSSSLNVTPGDKQETQRAAEKSEQKTEPITPEVEVYQKEETSVKAKLENGENTVHLLQICGDDEMPLKKIRRTDSSPESHGSPEDPVSAQDKGSDSLTGKSKSEPVIQEPKVTRRHDPESSIKCVLPGKTSGQCLARFKDINGLRAHQRRSHNVYSKYECLPCAENNKKVDWPRVSSLEKHLREDHQLLKDSEPYLNAQKYAAEVLQGIIQSKSMVE